MQLSVIIVNYNVKQFLKNLIESVLKAVENISYEIIVVDNASSDGSAEEIRNSFPHVKFIANKKNLGFGAANNQALEIAKGEFIVLINPDALVKTNTFDTLIKFFHDNPQTGMAGCKVLNPDGTLQLACRRSFPGVWTSFTKIVGLSSLFPKSKYFAKYNLTYLDENEIHEVDAISGSFMFFRKEVYEKVGGFDNDYFMYGEDLDLCYRVQKAGYKVYYVPTTEIIHYKGESTKRSSLDETVLFYDAMKIFVRKHFSNFFLVEIILRPAIFIRKLLAFINVYRLPIISVISDFTLLVFLLMFTEKLYAHGSWRGFPESVKPMVYILPAVFQIIVGIFAGAYKKNSLSILSTVISLIAGFILLSSMTFFMKQFAFSRVVVLLNYSFALLSFIVWRLIIKIIFRIGLETAELHKSTLVVTNGEENAQLIGKLKSNINSYFNIKGLIAIDNNLIGNKCGNYSFLGSIENIRKVIAHNKIQKVIFNSKEISFDKIFTVVSDCQGLNVEFLVSGSGYDFIVGKSNITLLDDIPLMKIEYNISTLFHQFFKRSLDLILSLVLLISVYPFTVLIKKVLKIDSDLIKFVLQIPQVLANRKSFVGPQKNSFINNLYIGKTGLTGFWYIENISPNDEDEIERLNIYYAKNQNIWLDLEILGRTISKMFFKQEK
ncbi:MAG: glycosyl transferase [Ignavibacteriales bacterium CG_4_9_14_3_um_filter_34_10]|nr:MAG: glycosyl transferase [Ignavibacteriales bacterium CG_4_9_14_3_um_filter_34_10]